MAIQIHQKRFDRQMVGATRWKNAKDLGLSHSNGWGTLWWETGTGKTFGACTIANKMLGANASYSFIVVVPGHELEEQWNREICNFVEEKYRVNFRVMTVHKAMEILNLGQILQCTLFIADELHEYYTEDRLRMFDGQHIITKWCLGLTADYEDSKGRHKNIQNILPVVDRIDPEEAQREGFISNFIEYNLGIEFTEKEQIAYDVLTDNMTRNLSKFGRHGLELASKVLRGDDTRTGAQIAFAYASHNGWSKQLDLSIPEQAAIHNTWNPNTIIGYAKSAMDAVRDRKTLIYCAMNKIRYARDLVLKFDTLKTICFSQSTAFADTLAHVINKPVLDADQLAVKPCVVYHSKLETQITNDPVTGKQKKKGKTVLKREAIDAIITGRARIISTASSLDRGFDVKDIRMAITTSGTQNPTQHRQRGGRAKRVESYDEDITVLIINLYAKGTQDEKWLRNRQSKSKNVIYWVDGIDDINYSPRKKESFNLTEI